MAYGARLESELGATPRGFKSRILRSPPEPQRCGRAPCFPLLTTTGRSPYVPRADDMLGCLVAGPAPIRRVYIRRTRPAIPNRRSAGVLQAMKAE